MLTHLLLPWISSNQSLAHNTYYEMGGKARYFAEPATFSEVSKTLQFIRNHHLPCALLGSGSNSIYSDDDFPGVVLSLAKLKMSFWEDPHTLFVEAGVTNTEIAEMACEKGWADAAWMYRMPGMIGASVRMNARCYGGETSEVVREIITMTTRGELRYYRAKEIFLGYKKTYLMDEPEVVIAVKLHFQTPSAPDLIENKMRECESDRHKKKHFLHPSCGSTFKNNYVVGKPSGQVFDELGFKGTRIGDVAVSEFHANFIWNLGKGKTTDFLKLTKKMRKLALVKNNYDLELEVQPVGLFHNTDVKDLALDRLGKVFSENEAKDKTWVGLLYHPNEEKKAEIIPASRFSSSFSPFGYKESNTILPKVKGQLAQLIPYQNSLQNKDLPLLKWSIFLSQNDLDEYFSSNLPSHPKFLDKLWLHPVSEMFLASYIEPNHYMEFEVTRDGHWLALKFDGVRKRLETSEKDWSGLRYFKTVHDKGMVEFGLTLTGEHIHPLLPKLEVNMEQTKDESLKLKMMLALSLPYKDEHLYLTSPPLSPRQLDGKVTPDFHQPSVYWDVKLKF